MEIEARKHVLALPVIFAVLALVVVVAEEVEGNDCVQVDHTNQKTDCEH